MSNKTFALSSGLRHIPVIMDGEETGRFVDFNPASQEFAEALYALVSRISEIHKAKEKERESETDILKKFDINRAEDEEMRAAVDFVFGAGFCEDVFKVRLFAVCDGLTVIENFLFTVMDEMDASIMDSIAKRDAQIKKYTEKYNKYKKYHN